MANVFDNEPMVQYRSDRARAIIQFACTNVSSARDTFGRTDYLQILRPAEIIFILITHQDSKDLPRMIFDAFSEWPEFCLKLAQVIQLLEAEPSGREICQELLKDERIARLLLAGAQKNEEVRETLKTLLNLKKYTCLAFLADEDTGVSSRQALRDDDVELLLSDKTAAQNHFNQAPKDIGLPTLLCMQIANAHGEEFAQAYLPHIIYLGAATVDQSNAVYKRFMQTLTQVVMNGFSVKAVDIAVKNFDNPDFIKVYFEYLDRAGRSMTSILMGKSILNLSKPTHYLENLTRFFDGDRHAYLSANLGLGLLAIVQSQGIPFYEKYANLIINAAAINPIIAQQILALNSRYEGLIEFIFQENLDCENKSEGRRRSDAIFRHWGAALASYVAQKDQKFVQTYLDVIVHACAQTPALVNAFSDARKRFRMIQDKFFEETSDAREIQSHSQTALVQIIKQRKDIALKHRGMRIKLAAADMDCAVASIDEIKKQIPQKVNKIEDLYLIARVVFNLLKYYDLLNKNGYIAIRLDENEKIPQKFHLTLSMVEALKGLFQEAIENLKVGDERLCDIYFTSYLTYLTALKSKEEFVTHFREYLSTQPKKETAPVFQSSQLVRLQRRLEQQDALLSTISSYASVAEGSVSAPIGGPPPPPPPPPLMVAKKSLKLALKKTIDREAVKPATSGAHMQFLFAAIKNPKLRAIGSPKKPSSKKSVSSTEVPLNPFAQFSFRSKDPKLRAEPRVPPVSKLIDGIQDGEINKLIASLVKLRDQEKLPLLESWPESYKMKRDLVQQVVVRYFNFFFQHTDFIIEIENTRENKEACVNSVKLFLRFTICGMMDELKIDTTKMHDDIDIADLLKTNFVKGKDKEELEKKKEFTLYHADRLAVICTEKMLKMIAERSSPIENPTTIPYSSGPGLD